MDIVNIPIISVDSRRVLGRLIRFQAGSGMVPGGFRMGSGRVPGRFRRGSRAVPGVPGFTDIRVDPTRVARMVTAASDYCVEIHLSLNKVCYLFLILNLKAFVKKEDVNILILGETGVGKSTWINGIANYAKHNSLEDAMGDPEFTVLIPSR